MRVYYLTIIILIFTAILSRCKSTTNTEQITEDANQIFDAFQKQLLTTLTKSLLEKGPIESIQLCNQESMKVENAYSKESWNIKRISSKPRNPSHNPDTWETSVLNQWSKEPNLRKMVVKEEESQIRIMRPILLGSPACLQCHGKKESIEPRLLETIQRQYPADLAIDYELGELRGAFSATYKK